MEQSRAAARLQRVATEPIEAAILVDRPRRFERRRNSRFADGVEVELEEPPAGIANYEANLDARRRSTTIHRTLRNGAYLGVTDAHLIVAGRTLLGRATGGIVRRPVDEVHIRWFDDETDAMRTRYMHLEFVDATWTVVATPWKRTIPRDADRILDAVGLRAQRLTTLVPPGSEQRA